MTKVNVKMANYKFIHDEIHGDDFPRIETIILCRIDLNLFLLQDCLRKFKAEQGYTSIDIFQVWEEQENGEWKRLDVYHNQGVKREPINTDKLYFYQMDKNPRIGDPLANMWVCCSAIKDWGTEEEIQHHRDFYKEHFARNYHNGNKNGQDDAKIVIVKGGFGNVADRDARAIEESDIVEKYNW